MRWDGGFFGWWKNATPFAGANRGRFGDVRRASAGLSPPVVGTLLSVCKTEDAGKSGGFKFNFSIGKAGGVGYCVEMKTIFATVVLMVCSVLHASVGKEEVVKQIKKWYASIESDKTLKATKLSSGEDEGPGLMELTRYESKGGELRKLHEYRAGEHGTMHRTYYFHSGKLFFIYETKQVWRFTGKQDAEGNSEVIDIASEYRYYYDDAGECIKALEKRLEIQGADELRELLKKVPNKEIVPVAAMNDFVRMAKGLSVIKTKKDLLRYLQS